MKGKIKKKWFLLGAVLISFSVIVPVATTLIVNKKEDSFLKITTMNNHLVPTNLSMEDQNVYNAARRFISQFGDNINISSIISNKKPILPYNLLDFSPHELANLLNLQHPGFYEGANNFSSYILMKSNIYLDQAKILAVNGLDDNINGTLTCEIYITLNNQNYFVGKVKYTGLDTIYTFFDKVIGSKDPFNVPKKWQWNVPNVNKFDYAWGQWAEIEYCLLQTTFDRLMKFKWFAHEVSYLTEAVNTGKVEKLNHKDNPYLSPAYIADFDTFDKKGWEINPYGTWLGNHGQDEHFWSWTSYIRFLNHTKWYQIGAYEFYCEMEIYLPKTNMWVRVPNIYINWWNVKADEEIEKAFQDAFSDLGALSSVASIFVR